jgi:hypothetical protein
MSEQNVKETELKYTIVTSDGKSSEYDGVSVTMMCKYSKTIKKLFDESMDNSIDIQVRDLPLKLYIEYMEISGDKEFPLLIDQVDRNHTGLTDYFDPLEVDVVLEIIDDLKKNGDPLLETTTEELEYLEMEQLLNKVTLYIAFKIVEHLSKTNGVMDELSAQIKKHSILTPALGLEDIDEKSLARA